MCDCIKKVNKAMESRNTVLDIGLRLDYATGQILPPRMQIATAKLDSAKKKGRPLSLVADYCPVCGEKYED